jgi:hypothetical protein
LERSAALTPGPARRADRALAAAQATSQAGAFDAALRLLAAAEAGQLDELQRAQAALLHGQIAFASFRGRDPETLLVKAARLFEPLDALLARETYLEALSAALFTGRLPPASGLREAGETARAAPPRRRGLRARLICCLTAWRCWPPTATRRARRCSNRRSAPSAATRFLAYLRSMGHCGAAQQSRPV